MMCIKGHYITWDQFLAKFFQYLRPVGTLCTCVLISDKIIPEKFPFGAFYFVTLTFHFYQKYIFLCGLWGNITALFSLELKKSVQKHSWKIQVCNKLISVIMENNQSHKSGANSMLYNLAIKGFPLSSHMFVWISPCFFCCEKCPSVTSMYLSIWTSNPGTKSDISSVMWQVMPESKIQLVSYFMSPKYLLGISTLEDIRAIYTYIFCDSFCSVIFSEALSIFVGLYAQVFFRVKLNSLFWIFRVWKICNPVLLRPTSKARIGISVFMLSTFIFGFTDASDLRHQAT